MKGSLMKKLIQPIKKQSPKIAIKAYFPNKKFVERMNQLSKRSGLSVSKLASMAMRQGLPQVETALNKMNVIEGDTK